MEEAELIRLCKKGDREAFNEIVLKYQNKVVNIAFGMLSHQEDAEDAAQEVFIKVYKNISSFKEESSFSTWVYRITANTCNDILKKRMNKKTVSIYGEDDDGADNLTIPDTSPPHDRVLEEKELQSEVRKAIGKLKGEYSELITLYDLEGFSYEEISGIRNIPIGTVKSRLSRARAQLKKNLEHIREHFL